MRNTCLLWIDVADASPIRRWWTCTEFGKRVRCFSPVPHTRPAMVARTQTSAAGVLALLQEPEPLVKQHALKALVPLVPQFWAEISEHVAFMSVFNLLSLFSCHQYVVLLYMQ